MPAVSPTPRGWAAALVVAAGTFLGTAHGGRSLFAVVLPLGAALAIGLFAVARADRPSVTRLAPEFTTVGSTESVRVADTLDDGLDGEGTVEVGGEEGAYEFVVSERGVHRIGPLEFFISDPLGLWRRRLRDDGVATLVAAPRVEPVDVPAVLGRRSERDEDRSEFEGVREYEHGDPLRDVNWKASARRPDELVVTTYAGEGADEALVVVADPADGDPDDVATAAASVAVSLLGAGHAVGLRTPTERVPAGAGDEHRRHILTALARLEAGTVPRERHAEGGVVVRGTPDGATVRVGGTTRSYAALAGESQPWENAFQP